MLAERGERTIYLRVLAPLLLAVLTLVVVSAGGFHILSAARAYVGGESLWSKASSQTVAKLRARLTGSSPEAECAALDQWLAIPLGDRAARAALDQPEPDLALARDGFLRGGNAADDIDAMIHLYRGFAQSSLMRDSIAAWRRGDELVDQLLVLGARICALPPGDADVGRRAANLTALDRLDAELLVVEARFSASLGVASRQTEQLLAAAIGLLAALLIGGGAWVVARSLRAQLAQRRALMDAGNRWELAADAAGFGVFVWRPGDDSLQLDARARRIFGLADDTPAASARNQIAALLHPDDRDATRALTHSANADGRPLRTRYRIVRPDTALRHIEAIGLLHDATSPDAPRQMIGVLRDVSDEVGAAQLQIEKDAAERAARARTEFLSRLSHELRTPLNAVLGLAQVLEVDRVEPLGPLQRQRIELILQSGWHLLHLVDDVLDITRIDSGMLEVDAVPTDLRAVLQTSLVLVERERADRGVQIDDRWPAAPVQVLADPPRLQQVFANLLSNACKYNVPGGRVTLGYSTSADEVVLTVADQGRGIAAADLGELFQPFKRLAPTADVPGTGLGLVVVKRLVEQMRGRIEVSSRVGQGTCFTVRLPAA